MASPATAGTNAVPGTAIHTFAFASAIAGGDVLGEDVLAGWDGYEKFMQGDDVHCGGAYRMLAEKIAAAICAELEGE